MVFCTVTRKNMRYLIAHNLYQMHLPPLNVLG